MPPAAALRPLHLDDHLLSAPVSTLAAVTYPDLAHIIANDLHGPGQCLRIFVVMVAVARSCLWRCIAPQKPYQTNLLLAGYDEGHGPSLYWMDYLATMHQMNIAGTGYGVLLL